MSKKKARSTSSRVDNDGLTAKQRLFVEEYLVDCNASQAAIRAGYSPKSAPVQGHENLKKPNIQKAVHEAMQARIHRTQMTQDEVLAELAQMARSDMGDFLTVNKEGDVFLDLANMPNGASRLIREITQEIYLEGMGEDAREVKRTKLKLHDKLGALKLLGTHLGMFATKHKVEFEDRHIKRVVLEGDDDE